MSRSLGIPVKLLHEAASHIVAVELKSGELYRGSLVKCEDNWNCQVENVTFTAKVKRKVKIDDLWMPNCERTKLGSHSDPRTFVDCDSQANLCLGLGYNQQTWNETGTTLSSEIESCFDAHQALAKMLQLNEADA